MMRILVTGANGFVGQHLCGLLVSQGACVTAAVRRAGTAPAGTRELLVGDLGPEVDWSEAVEGQDVVVHLAARVHVMAETESDPLEAFTKANAEGTRRLGEQAVLASVRRIVYVSSIKVNGEATLSGQFSADDVPCPLDPYGRSKLQAERELRKIESRHGIDVIVVRPPLIYGSGVGGNLLRLVKAVASGLPLPLGSVQNRRSMIAVENFVHILSLCATTSRRVRMPLLVADNEVLSTADAVREISSGFGRSPRLVSVSPGLLRLAGRVTGRTGEVDRLIGSLEISANTLELDPTYQETVSARSALRALGAAWAARQESGDGR